MPTRQHYLEKLKELQVELLQMGSLIEEAISRAGQAFLRGDERLAGAVIEGDREINRLERRIESICVSLIAMEQPVATDLRLLVAALKISGNLERIGDYAEHLANITLHFCEPPERGEFGELARMASIAAVMVRDGLQAFVRQDPLLATEARNRDDEVDGLYSHVFQRLLAYIESHPECLRQSISLLFAGKFLERLADHAANICEEVVFVCTGARDKPDEHH